MADAPPVLRGPEPRERRPALGYLMVIAAAVLFGLNGTVSKIVLSSGLSPEELTLVRSAGACVGFALALLAIDRARFAVRRRELPLLIVYGVAGVAFVQWFYFVAIERLPVGIALLIQYLAPLLVALFARYVLHEHVRRRIWLALACCLAGLTFVVELWAGLAFDSVGVAASLAAAAAYAVFVLMAEREVAQGRDPLSLSFYGFLFAAVFWLVATPIWSFPAAELDDSVSLLGHLEDEHAPLVLLVALVVVVGTMATFALITGALRHISAMRVGIAGMFEPVAASIVAWAWLGETFGAAQIAGGSIVLVGILLAQTSR
jgi:drug/metabolite transporter (DMT)-like permease